MHFSDPFIAKKSTGIFTLAAVSATFQMSFFHRALLENTRVHNEMIIMSG